MEAFALPDNEFILLFHDSSIEVETLKKLEDARAKAEFASIQKSRFLANISHEIRTPLNGIIGLTKILAKSPLQPYQKEYVEIIENSSEALLDILNDILDLSRLDAGNVELKPETINLKELLLSVKKSFELRYQDKEIEFLTDISDDFPAIVVADGHRIRQIFLNFYSNAVKFTEKGQVCLVARLLDKKTSSYWLRMGVKDSGPGIKKELQEKIFEEFTQADYSITREKGGAGLGLTICKKLTDLMGGKIGVDSSPGMGSFFFIDVEVGIPSPEEVKQLENVAEKKVFSLQDFEGMHVLIVEDNLINQKFLASLLKTNGISHDIAVNGREAVDLWKKNHYDCILMDIQMPVMDGLEATRLIREQEKERGNSHVPIFALTASAFDDDKDKFIRAGLDVYISKPVNEAKLLDALKNVYGKNQINFKNKRL